MPIKDAKKTDFQSLSPDVFVRDHVDDTGDVPFTGSRVDLSPDIIPMETLVIDPSMAFGGANWNEPFLEKNYVRYGKDNYIYVRVANRGTVKDYAMLWIYWGLSHDCIDPSVWNKLDSVKVANLLPRERRVVGPIVWPKAKNPGVGAYFLTAVVGSRSDPLNLPGPFATISDYQVFLRKNNNICHRNIAVLAKGMDTLPL